MKLELPMGYEAIRAIDRETFDQVIALSRSGERWNPIRRDAQRTLQRGLDCGTFGLDRNLKIRLRTDLDPNDNYVGTEASEHDNHKDDTMKLSTILAHAPTLGDDADGDVQLSVQEMVREHYRRRFGAAGDQIAEGYLTRLTEFAEAVAGSVASNPATGELSPPAPAAAERSVETDEAAIASSASRPSPTDHDRTPLRAVVVAMIDFHAKTTNERITIPQMEKLLRQWRGIPRVVGVHPVLAKTDADGGFSEHDESPLHIGSIARRLSGEGLIDKDAKGYAPKGTLAEEETQRARSTEGRARTNDRAEPAFEEMREQPTKPAEAQPKAAAAPETPKAPVRDPLDGIRDMLKTVGIDVKVGGVDLVKGVQRTHRTGNAMPLVTGLATAFLAAAAAAEANRPE
jgi:hypothetical protein